ncbi:uncharacterized protein [Mytilus edulis]|uniref:uncharacterized protein isoform X2 n=1 Tax=Mytilus edulis TaxID=6550 RepID=UPI0039F04FE2
MKIVDSSIKEEKMELEVGKWDKLKNWDKVQGDIGEMLKNVEKFDDSMTLYYGPQLYHTLRHPAHIKCMTHFTSNIGENFVSHYRLGTQDQLGVWTLKSVEPGAKCENQRFNITGEVKAFLFIPKHRTYMCFCSDLVMRMYTDVHSNCTESWSQQCLTTVRCMAYNRETDDVYVGGVGVLQKWKISGAEHSAKAEPGDIFNTDLQNDEWVIDIKVDTRNKQLMAVTYEGIYVVNYETMRQTHHLENRHGNSLRCCCFYKDREYFITGGGDGAIKVWNAVVFTQVHVFYGHHDVITALQTHKTDPLLFSSSLDGSVQIWRMDNFSKFMRLDLGDKIYSMKLIGDEEFYCQTENQIKIYSLNQFYNLFAPVESSVYKLQLSSGVKGHPSRIIASTEDGSVRLFSPVTGATLTIIYPMPTFQVLSCFAYSRENNRLHSVLQNGEVLLFNCDTNPCRAVEVWIPQTSDEEVLQIVQLTLAYEKEEVMVTDTVILGGMRNGQICLLEAEQCVMIKNVQAHVGTITCMEGATDIGMTGFKLLETNRKLATGGDDLFIKIWEIGVKANELFDSIFIQLLIKIPCVGMPEHICMYENTISVSTSDDSDKGKLHMYRLDGQESKEIQITTLQHTQDEDHTEHITAIDKCPLLGLFATASEDGYIKIWNRHNQLIREMGFGEPMHGLCFANIRGDILIGFQNHICTIPLTSYFPKNYLERITRQEFKDEVRETPLAYNHRIKPWFDPEALPKFSLSLTKRTEEKKPVEEENILEDLELTPRVPPCNPDIKIEEVIVKQDFIEIPAVTKSFQASYVKEVQKESNKKVEKIAKHTGMVEDDTVFDRGYSAPTPVPAKRMRIEKAREERRKSDTLYFEKLSQWERDLFNRKPIIAPDGYIPNSAVRKELGYVAPSSPLRKKKDTWTIQSIKVPAPPVTKTQEEQAEEDHHWEEVKARYLKFLDENSEDDKVSSSDESELEGDNSRQGGAGSRPRNVGRGRGKKKVRLVDSDDDDIEFDDSEPVEDTDIFPPGYEAEIGQDYIGGPYSLLRAGSDLKDFRPLSWGDNDDGRRSTNSTTPWRKMSNFIRASSTLSNRSTSSSKRGPKGRRQSTPTTPKYELKSKKFDLHRLDLDMGTPDRMRRSLGTKSRERTKSSFRLTNMVVDEQSTNVTFKDDSKSGHRKGMLPAVDMDVVRQLMDDLFPDLHGTASFDSILQNLIRMLDTEDEDLHKKICDYIISIHRDIGIQDHYLDRIISKLSVQLSGDNHSFKMDALSTLKVIGVDRQDVLAMILPRLIDSQEDIREQAKEVLAALCGVVNKDELLELMNSMGMTKQFDTKEAEEEALKELAMRLDVPYRSDSFADWINNWVDDTSSLYDSEPEVKLDDIDKAWDGRQRKWKPESLYLTESASRASTRMRELSFLSKGSPIRGLTDLSGTLSGYDEYQSDYLHSDEEADIHSTMTNYKQSDQEGQSLMVDDYDPEYTKNLLLNDLMKENSDKILQDGKSEFSDMVIEDKVVLNRPNSNEDMTEDVNMEDATTQTVDKGMSENQKKTNDLDSNHEGTPIQELDENDGELLEIEDLEKIKTQGQLSDRSSRSSNRSRRGVKFDPRDPSLYRYYKNRHIKERENDGKFNYKNMSKLFSKTQLGAGEDTDSQIGSMDSHSQVGDTLSTNDSGIISIQDSGIGRDMSDTYSYKSYKASPFLSKEKIDARAASYRPRQESHRKHNLSPVKSSSTIGGGSAKSTPREKEPDWMKFFQTPTALERKRMEMVKREYNEGKMKPGSALVVNYISEGLPMLPGEAGLRLLKSVKVGRHKGSLPPAEERHHMIESIPGKLGVHTKDEDKGQSKYGILQMQWTTAIPAPVSRNHYPERYSAMSGMSDATSELGGSTVRSVQSKCHLPAIIEKYGRSERTDTTEMTDFPHLPGGVYTPDYKWDYPIPPPPAKESRISIPYIKKEHERYCKYYTLVKKKMQNYTSKTLGNHTMKSSLPRVEIKKAIPEKLKLPKELTHISRVSSVLFPPITLNQLMSARS